MAILISIKPEYVCKILNREKLLEIRTTCPAEWKKYLDGKTNIKPKPCKVYIYCTKRGRPLVYGSPCPYYVEDSYVQTYNWSKEDADRIFGNLQGKVVAEFTLNKIDKIEICDPYIFRNNEQEDWKYFKKNACLTCEQIMEYIGYGKDYDGWDKKYDTGYAWHIDDLIIYEEPKELSEFEKYGSYETITDCYKKQNGLCNKGYGIKGNYIGCEKARIKRPPQSWCYVEDIKDIGEEE